MITNTQYRKNKIIGMAWKRSCQTKKAKYRIKVHLNSRQYHSKGQDWPKGTIDTS